MINLEDDAVPLMTGDVLLASVPLRSDGHLPGVAGVWLTG